MSSENYVRIVMAENLRFPGAGSSAPGKPEAKARQRCVADGQQVEIPVLHGNRTVGTHAGSGSRERRARHKHSRWCKGKAVHQAEGVKWTERK